LIVVAVNAIYTFNFKFITQNRIENEEVVCSRIGAYLHRVWLAGSNSAKS
jgi:hypothetical protein